MRISTLFTAFALVCALEMPAIAQEYPPPGAAQPEQSSKVLGTVMRGNTTIVFEAADPVRPNTAYRRQAL